MKKYVYAARQNAQHPRWPARTLAGIKCLFPDLFDGEDQLKLDDLKQLAGETVHNKERYDFTWSGKQNTNQAAYSLTTAALTYDETRSVNPDKANGNLIIEGENMESLYLPRTRIEHRCQMESAPPS